MYVVVPRPYAEAGGTSIFAGFSVDSHSYFYRTRLYRYPKSVRLGTLLLHIIL